MAVGWLCVMGFHGEQDASSSNAGWRLYDMLVLQLECLSLILWIWMDAFQLLVGLTATHVSLESLS